METYALFCCIGTTDRKETELHSRRRHSNSRTAATCDGHPRPHMDLDSSVQILSEELLESTFICTKPQVHIISKLAAIIILVQRLIPANDATTPYFGPLDGVSC
jgi:hypothetical protein